MKWVMIANTNNCRIYDYHRKEKILTLLKEFDHPENKLKNQDLVSDKPGHYCASTAGRGAYSQQHDPEDIKIDNFARELALHLEDARNKKSFNELITVMSSKMEGLLHHYLHKNVRSVIKHNIQKNLMHMNEHELIDYFAKNL